MRLLHRGHAILGTSPSCIATHPLDICVALAILEPTLVIATATDPRTIPFDELHLLPGARPLHQHRPRRVPRAGARRLPELDVSFLEEPDLAFNALGARGVGEIGITGTPSAIANAVYNATGKRIRDLPITVAKVLK